MPGHGNPPGWLAECPRKRLALFELLRARLMKSGEARYHINHCGLQLAYIQDCMTNRWLPNLPPSSACASLHGNIVKP